MTTVSLETLFLNNLEKLKNSLQGLTIPKDTEKIQKNISDFFSELLLEEGDFRQNLTQPEDYILQAVLAILNAQQARCNCLPKAVIEQHEIDTDLSEEGNEETQGSNPLKDKNVLKQTITEAPKSLIIPSVAAGAGTLVGGAVLGTWGGVCGAIACTALAAYYVSNNFTENKVEIKTILKGAKVIEKSLDIDFIINVIQNLCHSIDDIIVTFRAQINNVVTKYESAEKPTIEREYSTLLENIQSLVGYMQAHEEDEKYVKKLQERINDLAESLENYNLSLANFSEDNAQWFDFVPAANATTKKQVYPAIVKNGQLIKKGKMFIPEI